MNKSQTTFQSAQYTNPKCITAIQVLCLFSKSQMNKQRLLKQLQQLDIDITVLKDLSLHQIYNSAEPIMKNTYSIKYLGLNKNQMGIISRRIDPTKDSQSILNQSPIPIYTINKYFYPKPLKIGKKKPKQEQINVQNLENQIKKSFQTTTTNKKNKKSDGRTRLDKKKEIHGSWLSIGKIKNVIYNEKREKLKNIDENKMTINDMVKPENKSLVNSYAHFLNKGIILIKDSLPSEQHQIN